MSHFDRRGCWSRPDKKRTVDQLPRLDVGQVAQAVDLSRVGSLTLPLSPQRRLRVHVWPQQGVLLQIVAVSPASPASSQTKQPHTTAKEGAILASCFIGIEYTTPHYGGQRAWFRCPRCDKRVRLLYLGSLSDAPPWRCRTCHQLTYASSQCAKQKATQTAVDNRLLRLRRKLRVRRAGEGGVRPLRPPHMRWTTYARLVAEYEALQLLAQAIRTQEAGEELGVDLLYGDLIEREWQRLKAGRVDEENVFVRHFQVGMQLGYIEPPPLEHAWHDPEYAPGLLRLRHLAEAAGVPWVFAKQAVGVGLVRPDWQRGRYHRRYRPKLARWLAKLYRLRAAGMAWEEIRGWTQRRWRPEHAQERTWPAGVASA